MGYMWSPTWACQITYVLNWFQHINLWFAGQSQPPRWLALVVGFVQVFLLSRFGLRRLLQHYRIVLNSPNGKYSIWLTPGGLHIIRPGLWNHGVIAGCSLCSERGMQLKGQETSWPTSRHKWNWKGIQQAKNRYRQRVLKLCTHQLAGHLQPVPPACFSLLLSVKRSQFVGFLCYCGMTLLGGKLIPP